MRCPAAESAGSADEYGSPARPDVNDQRVQETADFLQQEVASQYGLSVGSDESSGSGLGSSSDDQEAPAQYHQSACGTLSRVWLRLQQDPHADCHTQQHPRCYGPKRSLMQYGERDGKQYFWYSINSGQQLRFVHSTVSKEDA